MMEGFSSEMIFVGDSVAVGLVQSYFEGFNGVDWYAGIIRDVNIG